jgi:iron complex outermembrane receptor protein
LPAVRAGKKGEGIVRNSAGFVSTSLIALAAATSAWAQAAPAAAPSSPPSAAPAGGQKLEEIVVTATRQATNLQATPIAITAVTAKALEERGITNVGDLTSVIPNAQFRPVQGAFGPGVSAFIRGIGSGDTSLGGESGVAFYIDDVYYPLLLGANFDLLDVDHIEVLRGPQGTLFGRNALAGAVNIVGKQPSTAAATGYAEFTTGSYDRHDARAGFNLPLSDTMAVMVSGMSKQRQGYEKVLDFTCEMNRRGTPQLAGSFPQSNVLTVQTPNFTPSDCTVGHLGGQDLYGARGAFLWQPTSSFKLNLNVDYTHDGSQNVADTAVDMDSTRANSNLKSEAAYYGLAYDHRFLTGSPYETYATYRDPIPAGAVIPGNTYYTGVTVNGRPTRGGYQLPPNVDVANWGVSGKLGWDLGHDIGLTAVGAYRTVHDIHAFDTDGTPLNVEMTLNDIREDYWNSEVRLAGKSKLVDWVVGGFYFTAHGVQHASLIQSSIGAQRTIFTTYDPTSKAVFGNATVRPFGDQLSFTVGGRYSDDQKIVNFSNLVDTSPSPADIRFRVVPQQRVFEWKGGVNYQLNNSVLLYASAASGNSLPGYNPRPLQTTQVFQFDGNDDIAYEIGAKLDLFDRRLRLNAAGFYTDFLNRPTAIGGAEAALDSNNKVVVGNQQLLPLPGGPAGSTLCSTSLLASNTGIVCIGRTYYVNQPASVRGFELEYTINPIDRLVINGSTGWSEFRSPDIAARAVNRRQSNPFWTADAGAQYEIPIDRIQGSITPRLDWTYETSQIVSGTSTKYNYLMPAHSIVNGRITYNNEPLRFSLALGVTNLFNQFSWVNVFDYQGLGYPQTEAQPAHPREWYLTLRKQF